MRASSQKISIIIPTKDRPQDLARCLESIFNQTLLPGEIIIVDASDTEEIDSLIESYSNEKAKVRFIRSEPGLTHQKNIGVEASCGDILFFFDDDVTLEKDYIKEVVDVFDHDQDGKVAGVCGKVVSLKNKQGLSPRSIVSAVLSALARAIAAIFLLRKPGDGTFRVSGFANYPYATDEVKTVEFLSGGLTAWRRGIFAEFKFDENLVGYCYMEDVDFSYRVSRKYKNVYAPFARALHDVSASPTTRIAPDAKMNMLIRNYHYLFKKNLPQTLKHKLAFCWAVVGLCLSATLQAIVERNIGVFKGLIAGLINILMRRNKLRQPRA